MNTSQAEGVFDQAKGKLKQALGEAIHNEGLANEGAADQLKGSAKETWGNVKDAAAETAHRHEASAEAEGEHTGHGIRASITQAAEDAKNSINRGIDHLKNR